MKRALPATLGLVLAGLPALAAAFEVELEPLEPVVVGDAAQVRLAEVTDATGEVELFWNLGDGTQAQTGPDGVVDHVYDAPGRYPVTVIARDSTGARAVATDVQKVHLPLPEGTPAHSGTMAFDAAAEQIWNVNRDNGSVTATQLVGLDLDPLVEIPVGPLPRNLALAPDGTVWVTVQGTSEIAVVDLGRQAVVDRIALPPASQPHGIAFAPSGVAYVSLYATGELVEIDAQRRVVRTVALGPTPAAIAVTHGGRILVTRFISPDAEGQIYEVAPDSFALLGTLSLPFDPGPDDESGGRGVPNYLSSIVVSPDGAQAWVTAKKDNIARGPLRDGMQMAPDSFVRAVLCTLDLATNEERLLQRVDINNRALPMAVAFSDIGDYGFVAALGSNWVGFQNPYGTENLGGIKDVGLGPDGLVLAPGGRLVVHASLSRALKLYDVGAVLDGSDETAPAPAETVLTVITEALSPDVLAGKQIFHNAADERMSGEGYMACASCHFEGEQDGRIWDFSDRGEGLRNTKSLRALAGQGRLHWSANFDELQDFERDIRESFAGAGFMDEAAWAQRKDDPFGLPSAGVSVELDQLAAYIESLAAVPPSPFRNPDGTLTDAARRGRAVFERSGCPACHGNEVYTDSADEMLHDVGTLLPTSGQRLGDVLEGIDTPTLMGLWATPPYLHDGRAPTIVSIFTEHNPDDRIGETSRLTAEELADLEAYMLQLDGTEEPPPPKMEGCRIGAGRHPPIFVLLCLVGLRRRVAR